MFRNFKLDPRLLKDMNYKILFSTIAIACFGIFNIYLGTYAQSGIEFALKQGIFFIISLIVMYFMLAWDYNIIYGYVDIFYWGSIVMLIITRFIGTTINGARGWIVLGPVSIQPSEFAKIAMILMLAKQLDKMDMNINNFRNLLKIVIYAIIPMVFIFVQPDMGMTMVCFFIVVGIVYCAGLDLRILFSGLAAVIVLLVLVWHTNIIHPYQKQRLSGFLHPNENKLGINLQLNQSMIGIGSGGFTGTGADLSSESGGYASQFVPEKQTDFIFTVIGEHWGTIGAACLLILYGILIKGMIDTGRQAKDNFGTIISIGLASYFIFAILQNIGMTIGLMPITGITLPMVSYGGSSLLTTIACIGLVLNINMRKRRLHF
ncbi:rod shape-determining protein RodA [Clostridium sp.]|uniref:rod shape-determining protein RodA n=1 Tax=Clostridium sp. TaxID=1506 RepID=UPI003994B093